MRKLSGIALMTVLLLSVVACNARTPEPQLAGSEGSPGYAISFAERLASTKKDFGAQESQAHDLAKRFSELPDGLDNPDWDGVATVVDLADQEGRSEAYVERFERMAVVATFYMEERTPIRSRVAGAVQHAAKEKSCSEDLGGSAVYALDKAIEERVAEQLHAVSDAQAYIDEHEDELGKKNVEPLRDQADQISRASYLAFVGMVRTKVRLAEMLDELSGVQKTLDRRAKELSDAASAPDLDAKKRKAIEERQAKVERAKAALESEIATARSLSEAAETHVQQTQKAYETALESLRERLEQKREEKTDTVKT